MTCKLCKELIITKNQMLYLDRMCLIEKWDTGMRAIYWYHQTPSLQHKRWIELQLKILADKAWNRSGIKKQAWEMRYIKYEHPHWIVFPNPDMEVKKKQRIGGPLKIKEVEE